MSCRLGFVDRGRSRSIVADRKPFRCTSSMMVRFRAPVRVTGGDRDVEVQCPQQAEQAMDLLRRAALLQLGEVGAVDARCVREFLLGPAPHGAGFAEHRAEVVWSQDDP